MSKRFGRNQKRKLSAQLAALQKEVNTLQKSVCELKEQNQLEKECIQLTQEVIGEYFPSLVPKKVALRENLPFALSLMQTRDRFQTETDDLMFAMHQLRGLEYTAQVDKLRNMLYVRVETPKGETVAFNYNFQQLPDHIIEQILKRDFVPMLVKQIKRG
ncbi:hypothetical protein [Escherichia phage EC_OE_11]|nr:hypothetical protein ECGD1_207 [Enterobacteria phage ECGD1]UVF09760.1 hypothetical protein [Escherichia phage pEC-M2929-1AR.1]WBF54206.1 hypothetical protein [Escherichia phage EC_OE_11]